MIKDGMETNLDPSIEILRSKLQQTVGGGRENRATSNTDTIRSPSYSLQSIDTRSVINLLCGRKIQERFVEDNSTPLVEHTFSEVKDSTAM